MANCNRQQLNITCGTDIVLQDRLIFDGETFDPNLSVGIAANLVNSLGKRTALDVQVVDDELLISVPWVEGTLPGCYGLEVTGSCNSKKWSTYADSLIRYTKATRPGASEVTIESDTYDITQEVGYCYSNSPVTFAEVTVDDGYGTPSVDVTYEQRVLSMAFHNLKGDPFTYEDFTPAQLEALRGPQGDSAVYDPDAPDAPDFVMANTTGNSTTKAMTQDSITKLFNSLESRIINNIFETVEEGLFVTDFAGNIGFSVRPDAQNNVIVKSNSSKDDVRKLRVLNIGNSFSTDALSYVPPLLNDAGVEFVIGYLNKGGASLAQHLEYWDNESTVYTYYKHDGEKWTSRASTSVGYAIADEAWDIVILQEASGDSGKADTVMASLPTMITNVKGELDGVKIGWLMTPAWGTQNSGWGASTYANQAEMYAGIVDVAKKVRDMCEVDFLIPEATAIQNARGTSLDAIGADLFASSSDRHLEDGTGRLIAAMTVYNTIWKAIVGKSLMQISFLPIYGTNVVTDASSDYYYPETSSFAEVTAPIAQVAKACANAAMADMFAVTEIYELNNE